jgi:hypothetical protein
LSTVIDEPFDSSDSLSLSLVHSKQQYCTPYPSNGRIVRQNPNLGPCRFL